jgi:hypothetical protein
LLTRKLEASDRPERDYWSYMHARVLAPAGLTFPKERFALDQKGQPNLPGGAHLTAREWAQWGEFVRRGCAVKSVQPAAGAPATPGPEATGSIPESTATIVGQPATARWTPVIDRDALEQCFVGSTVNPQYGLTWWLLTGADGAVADTGASEGTRMRRRLGRKDETAAPSISAAQTEAIRDPNGTIVKAVMAAGAGKQRLYLLPEHGLVIVRLAEMGTEGASFNDTRFLKELLGMTGDAPSGAR